MKRIAVVLACNTHWAPYYRRYENELKKNNMSFDLIIWNREDIVEEVDGNVIEFKLKDETSNHDFKKIFKFFKFAKFLKNRIKKNKYDKIVFLGTYAGIPALLSGYLKRNYKKNYWIDIRDLTYENNQIFRVLESKAINNSFSTVISSKGFLPYLPEYGYGYIHNVDPSMDYFINNYNKTETDIIRISYIGNIGYFDACYEFIDTMANDNRFLLQFIGPSSEIIKQYCEKNNITNVRFGGRFPRELTVKYYNETDIIYNNYGNGEINLRTATSNKLYYAMRLNIPIIVSPNTYMEEICLANSIGISFDGKKSFPDRLEEFYHQFIKDNKQREATWANIVEENNSVSNSLRQFLIE